jgi:hypothetical protein
VQEATTAARRGKTRRSVTHWSVVDVPRDAGMLPVSWLLEMFIRLRENDVTRTGSAKDERKGAATRRRDESELNAPLEALSEVVHVPESPAHRHKERRSLLRAGLLLRERSKSKSDEEKNTKTATKKTATKTASSTIAMTTTTAAARWVSSGAGCTHQAHLLQPRQGRQQ